MILKVPKAWDSWRAIPKDDPKRLAKLAEAAFKLDQVRAEAAATAEAAKSKVREIKEEIINNFSKADITEIKTKLGTARLDAKNVPNIDPDTGGWDAVYKYITKHKAWDILQKRFGEKACQERWEAGEEIPGVKKFWKMDIKLGEAE